MATWPPLALCGAIEGRPLRWRCAAVKRERLIRRYKHNHFRGWVVAVKRRGRRWTKYFSDRPDGRLEALRRARGYRDALLQGLKAWERPSGVTTRKIMFMIPAGSGGKIIPRGAQ